MPSNYENSSMKSAKFQQKFEESDLKSRKASDLKSVFNKIDINSISVRKFNLDDGGDDTSFNKINEEAPTMRVCLPIFT